MRGLRLCITPELSRGKSRKYTRHCLRLMRGEKRYVLSCIGATIYIYLSIYHPHLSIYLSIVPYDDLRPHPDTRRPSNSQSQAWGHPPGTLSRHARPIPGSLEPLPCAQSDELFAGLEAALTLLVGKGVV